LRTLQRGRIARPPTVKGMEWWDGWTWGNCQLLARPAPEPRRGGSASAAPCHQARARAYHPYKVALRLWDLAIIGLETRLHRWPSLTEPSNGLVDPR